MAGAARRQGAEQVSRSRRIGEGIPTYRPVEFFSETLVARGQSRQSVPLEFLFLVPVELVYLVGNVQHPLRESYQHGGDEQCLWSSAMHRRQHLPEVIEAIRPVAVRRDNRLVLDCNTNSLHGRLSLCIRLTNEQVNLAQPIAWRGHILPDLNDSGSQIAGKRRARGLQVRDNAVADDVRVCSSL